MSRNGSGIFSLPAGNPVASGTAISATVQNNTMSDIATAITGSLASDGQTVPTANLPMGGFKHTGAAKGSAATDYSTVAQLQGTSINQLSIVSGADTIAATATPAPAAYAAGQRFSFISAGANTTAVTLNISSLGAKAVTLRGATALLAGNIVSGQLVTVEYDGTRFQLLNPATLLLSDWFASGTVMAFFQSSAPTGWTQVTTHNNKAMRIVSGTGGGSGGSVAFTTAFASQAVAGTNSATTLSSAQIPDHSHTIQLASLNGHGGSAGSDTPLYNGTYGASTAGMNGTSGQSHNHTFTGTAINLAVQYIDMIIASKN